MYVYNAKKVFFDNGKLLMFGLEKIELWDLPQGDRAILFSEKKAKLEHYIMLENIEVLAESLGELTIEDVRSRNCPLFFRNQKQGCVIALLKVGNHQYWLKRKQGHVKAWDIASNDFTKKEKMLRFYAAA